MPLPEPNSYLIFINIRHVKTISEYSCMIICDSEEMSKVRTFSCSQGCEFIQLHAQMEKSTWGRTFLSRIAIWQDPCHRPSPPWPPARARLSTVFRTI